MVQGDRPSRSTPAVVCRVERSLRTHAATHAAFGAGDDARAYSEIEVSAGAPGCLRGRLPGGLARGSLPRRRFLCGHRRRTWAPGGRRRRSARIAELERTLNNLREHRARFAALRRTMGDPDVGIVLGENVGEVAFTFHADRRELRDVHLSGPVVAVLDQQPAASAAAT